MENVNLEDDCLVPLTDYAPDGVDLTLIRWFLSFTPAERLQYLQQFSDDVQRIRELNARR